MMGFSSDHLDYVLSIQTSCFLFLITRANIRLFFKSVSIFSYFFYFFWSRQIWIVSSFVVSSLQNPLSRKDEHNFYIKNRAMETTLNKRTIRERIYLPLWRIEIKGMSLPQRCVWTTHTQFFTFNSWYYRDLSQSLLLTLHLQEKKS